MLPVSLSVCLRVLSRGIEPPCSVIVPESGVGLMSVGLMSVGLVSVARGAELAGMSGVDVGGASLSTGTGVLVCDVLVPRIARTDGRLVTLLGGVCAEASWGRGEVS